MSRSGTYTSRYGYSVLGLARLTQVVVLDSVLVVFQLAIASVSRSVSFRAFLAVRVLTQLFFVRTVALTHVFYVSARVLGAQGTPGSVY